MIEMFYVIEPFVGAWSVVLLLILYGPLES